MLHLRWQPSPPPVRLVALTVAAFLLAACSGPSGVDPRGNPISFAPSTADCAQATALIAEGFPQRAVALIDQMNQDLTDDQPRRCIDERAAALGRVAASGRLAQAAAALGPPAPVGGSPGHRHRRSEVPARSHETARRRNRPRCDIWHGPARRAAV